MRISLLFTFVVNTSCWFESTWTSEALRFPDYQYQNGFVDLFLLQIQNKKHNIKSEFDVSNSTNNTNTTSSNNTTNGTSNSTPSINSTNSTVTTNTTNATNVTQQQPIIYHRPRPKGLSPSQMQQRLDFYDSVVKTINQELNNTQTGIKSLKSDIDLHEQSMLKLKNLIENTNRTVVSILQTSERVSKMEEKLSLPAVSEEMDDKIGKLNGILKRKIEPVLNDKGRFEEFRDELDETSGTIAIISPKIEKLHKDVNTLGIRVRKLPGLPRQESQDWVSQHLIQTTKEASKKAMEKSKELMR